MPWINQYVPDVEVLLAMQPEDLAPMLLKLAHEMERESQQRHFHPQAFKPSYDGQRLGSVRARRHRDRPIQRVQVRGNRRARCGWVFQFSDRRTYDAQRIQPEGWAARGSESRSGRSYGADGTIRRRDRVLQES